MSTLQTRVRKTHRQPGAPDFTLDVDHTFEPGITAIFGPSGSGKSTWLECIAGLQRPESGLIVLQGRRLADSAARIHLPPAQRSLGYVFQNAALFPHLTVRQNVEYGLAHLAAGERRTQAMHMLAGFHVAELAEKRPHAISGGERQRVALARALVREPECLLLDEPFSALDYDTKVRIMDDVREWDRGRLIPVVLVTHALEEVFALAPRVVMLDAGHIVSEGTPAAVLAAQRDRLRASLSA